MSPIMGTGTDGTTVPMGRDEPIMTRKNWGNSRWIAGELFEEVMLHYLRSDPLLRTPTNVFELGSGWTTVLLSREMEKRPELIVTSLEHIVLWYDKVEKYAPLVDLHLLPLIDYGEYIWYDIHDVYPIDPIDLLLVDGPPRVAPGEAHSARYGALPILEPYLAPGCKIIIDDQTSEHEMALEWIYDFGCTIVYAHSEGDEDVLVLEYPGSRQVEI